MPKLQVDLIVDDKGSLAVKNFSDNTDRYMHTAAGSVQKFAAVATGLTGILAGMGGGMIAGGFLETAASFETYEATLKTVSGSAEKARKQMEWIRDFAKETPYEVNQLTESFVKLSAYGIDGTKYLK